MSEREQSLTIGLYGERMVEQEAIRNYLPSMEQSAKEIRFEVEPEQCDIAIVLNQLHQTQRLSHRKGFLWKLVGEPYVPNLTDYAVSHDEQFDRIYCPGIGATDSRVVSSPPILPWLVKRDFDELLQSNVPPKEAPISAVASTKGFYPGHKTRLEVIDTLTNAGVEFDLFGRGREREVDDKWDALAPYYFSIAIENSSQPDYFTEKIIDCFLTYTVPVYFGAPNISEYFPKDSYVSLPIDDAGAMIRALENLSMNAESEWKRRLPALQVARDRALRKYSPFVRLRNEALKEFDSVISAPFTTSTVTATHKYLAAIKRRLKSAIQVFSLGRQ